MIIIMVPIFRNYNNRGDSDGDSGFAIGCTIILAFLLAFLGMMF